MERHTGGPPQDVHDIKALLGKRGVTQGAVGRLCNPPVSQQAVSAVLRRETTSYRIEVALAEACGVTLGHIQNVTRECPSRVQNDSDIDSDTRSARTRPSVRVAA